MVSSRLKKGFEEIISASVRPLVKTGLTPNTITILGLFTSLAATYCYVSVRQNPTPFYLIAAGSLVLLSGLFDAIDGILARLSGKVTVFGGFFDSVIDRYSDAFTLTGVILSGLCDPVIGTLTLIGSMMVSYARSRSEAAGIKMAGIGLVERAERLLILSSSTFLTIVWSDALSYGITLLAILTHLTVLQRILHFRKTVF